MGTHPIEKREEAAGMKTIKFYRTVQYGCIREFVHPDCKEDAERIERLTGKKTIDSVVRGNLVMLAGSGLEFVETVMP